MGAGGASAIEGVRPAPGGVQRTDAVVVAVLDGVRAHEIFVGADIPILSPAHQQLFFLRRRQWFGRSCLRAALAARVQRRRHVDAL